MSNTKKYKTQKSFKNSLIRKLSYTRVRIVLFVSIFALLGTAYILKSNAQTTLSTARSKIVYIANSQIGQTEFSSQVLNYTDGNREAWCADYVSWVYKEAGYPFVSGLSGGWRWPVASRTDWDYSLRNYVTYIGKYKSKDVTGNKSPGSYVPEAGDIIFFNPDTYYSHTGIVTSVGNGRVNTTEGNVGNINPGSSDSSENGGKVDYRSYLLTDSKILGYGDMF